MVNFSSSSQENECYVVDSFFNEDSKNIIFSREVPILGRGRPENSGKMGNNRDIYCHANQGDVNFDREYWLLPPRYRNLCNAQLSFMPDQILGKKNGKFNFQAKIRPFLLLSSPKI